MSADGARVLAALRRAGGQPCSGEALSTALGVSRAQVWKHVETLRRRGYEVAGEPGGGYRLAGVPDRLYPEEIEAGLETRWLARDITYLDSTDSTNRVASDLARAGAAHGTTVIAEAQSIIATLSSGESYPAEVIGGDFQTDLAVIRISAPDLLPAKLGVSSELEVGEDVIAIGHALGLAGGPTVSKGVVSALGRSIDTDSQNTIVELIQTDAQINPGNSGGALVNNDAEVVGINTAIIQSARGIGFAINIDDAKEVARQLIDQDFVRRGFLGITPINLTPGIAMQLDLPVSEGVLIVRVYTDTAAAEGGLLLEDIIVELDGEAIRNTGDLAKFLISHQPGYSVDIVVVRDGSRLTIQLTLGDRPN